MDIQVYGANCVVLTTKQARIVIDDNLADLDTKSQAKEGDIALFTMAHGEPSNPAKIVIDTPGEYEVSGISIYGIQTRAHIDEQGNKTATMYKLIIDDLRVLVSGHIYPDLSDKQLEEIGMVDLMIVPVGGNGYTLDGAGALKLIKKIEPKLVIPTHYAMAKLQYPVPQQSLEEALKNLAMEAQERVTKLKLKASDLSDVTQLIVVES